MTLTLRRLLCTALMVCLTLGTASASAATAVSMASTSDVLASQQTQDARERIHSVLARDDVRQQLELQGVDPADVEQRVAALSDQEAQQMADQLDQMPAGASVIGVLFAVFVILLVTDILGLTDVYPFTR
ncbi:MULTISPECIES: PA2779 family protein [Halomonas]|uniref:PA2779 family protein n=1 Tax=Halomonas TaxID=2745 RepID=UPI001A8F1E0D|nr:MULTISPECIES: PA2779 family protein [Halomonas]MED5296083.1 PA2779 family protein [Pseudomonadota bacterium]MBN8413451.1 PA2779 family protein [Halomonas litopenaei]MBY5931088.1 PA2779 family protein [Halomonas sp. DP8Y7-3]MBY6030504.1 PA2779 family protein [Halomonas sp. DP8Y7-1]MBY6209239.1 PA2779 family protein [Halomonas sp. DP3Y7-2]